MNWLEFQHEAMATTFSIAVAQQPAAYARQAAAAAFRELDRLENELSRYIESSDIARANRLAEGESTVIGDDALQCLLLACAFTEATGRAFDPAYASARAGDSATGTRPFTLDPQTHTLTSQAPRLHLDLGAIGKGYALDRLADILREWTTPSACLQSGGSTALALAGPTDGDGWPVGLDDARGARVVTLTAAALSGSGIAVKGAHLIDPRSGEPSRRTDRVWALAPSAAAADALSTAFFVMTDTEITAFCAEHAEIGAAIGGTTTPMAVHGRMKSVLRGG